MRGMASFAGRKALIAVALLFTLATVVLWVNQAIPQDAGSFLLRNVPNPTREQVPEANHRLGVDRPALEQYADFVGGLVRGDLGVSWTTATYVQDEGVEGESVARLVLRAQPSRRARPRRDAAPRPRRLAARAVSCIAGRLRLRPEPLLLSLAFVSTHPLVAALILQLVFGRKLGWLPGQGYCPFFGTNGASALDTAPVGCGGPFDWASHLVLPWLSFSLLLLALYLRVVRTQSLTVLHEPFVTVARAKGASEQQVLRRHVVPAVVTVVVAMVAMDVGAALGIALFVEVVYGLPGLGRLLIVALQGFSGFDRPVIVGIVLVTGAVVILANVVADLLAAAIDPRARTRDRRGTRTSH